MNSIAWEFPLAVVPKPVPVVVDKIISIRAARYRPLPQFVVERGRYRCFPANTNRLPIVRIPTFTEIRPTNDAAMHFLYSSDNVRPRAALVSNLNHDFWIFGCRLAQQMAVMRSSADGLFHVNVFTSLAS